MHSYFTVFAFCLFLLTSCDYKRKITAENISLSPVYSSGMILQTSPVTIISGKADPAGILAVRIKDYMKLIQTDDKGNWSVEFPEIILKEPFSIRIEGKDTSITFDNIHTGKIIIIAGDGNLPALHYQNYKNDISPLTQNVRIYTSQIQDNQFPKHKFSEGKWYLIDTIVNQNRISQLINAIRQVLPESDSPLGIIDLTWPGSGIESWLNVERSTQLNELSINQRTLDSALFSYEEVYQQINAMQDTCMDAFKKGVARIWFDDEYWRITELPVIMSQKDDYRKKRIVYLRKKINIPSKYLTSDFLIDMGQIHGNAQFYFNETKIDSRVNKQGMYQLVIPDSVMCIWSNILTVRLFCTDSLCGFFGDEFICHNLDSSYYRSVHSDWKYSFNMENSFPEPIPLEQADGLAYNTMLSPIFTINAESILFLFRTNTFCRTQKLGEKLCTISSALPESWKKQFIHQTLTLSDTVVYGLDKSRIDSILMEDIGNCDIEVKEINMN